VRKILVAASMSFVLAGVAQAVGNDPSAQGKWAFNFTRGRTISFADANIVQDEQGTLSSPWFQGTIAGSWYQNFEAYNDSTCSPSGWAPVQPTGSNVNGTFNFRLFVDTGMFYDLKGSVSVSANGTGATISGTYTSNCSGDQGLFTAALYAPANNSYVGIVKEHGTGTQYTATLTLTEDTQFNVSGSLTFGTEAGTSSCYGTVNLAGPATGDFIELSGANANVENLGMFIVAATPDFSSVKVWTLQVVSLSCGNSQAQGSFTWKTPAPKPRNSPR
jgi:hypothetical protein